MSHRRERQVRELCEREGLAVESIEIDGRGHLSVRLAGRPGRLTFARTPSDGRGDLNKRAMLRRIARGLEGKMG